MDPLNAIAVIITLTTVFAYFNHKFMKMPMSIGLMIMSLVVSLALIALETTGIPISRMADEMIRGIDFSKILLEGMLSLLLFAGALHVNLNDLSDQKLEISFFATVGVLCSTFLVGGVIYGINLWLEWHLRMVECLLFGALISPTDPIAVLGIMKKAGAPKSLETKIAGESLFNDGIGVVIFLVLLEIAGGHTEVTAGSVAVLFFKEAAGGVIYGFIIGYAAYRLLRSINNYQVEVMITLALVVGGYALGGALHVSAPLAIVVAGLLIGNQGRQLAMSEITRDRLDNFWELVDEILNSILFVLIGLEVLILTLRPDYLLAGLLAILVALFSRFISIGLPVSVMSRWRPFAPNAVAVLTWGGLRGGISVALALSLPYGPARELILSMTYVVVIFSVVVQGLTIKRLVQAKPEKSAAALETAS